MDNSGAASGGGHQVTRVRSVDGRRGEQTRSDALPVQRGLHRDGLEIPPSAWLARVSAIATGPNAAWGIAYRSPGWKY